MNINCLNRTLAGILSLGLFFKVQASVGATYHEANDDLAAWMFIAYGINILLILLIFWFRFRKESKEKLSTFVLTHHRLNLNVRQALTHFGHVFILLTIPIPFTTNILFNYITKGEEVFPTFYWCFILLFWMLALITYCYQHSILNFKPIVTTKTTIQIQNSIRRLSNQHDWIIEYIGKDYIEVYTKELYSFFWGERIYVVFDKKQVWVNNTYDLNKINSGFPLGYSKKNFRLLKKAIEI